MSPARVSSFVSLATRLTLGIACLGSAGCGHAAARASATAAYGSSAYVVVQRPPVPYATVHAVGAPPFEGAQWVEAHWEWSGSDYVWMSGYWIRPSTQYAFVQPRWQEYDGGYVYAEGGWSDHTGAIVVTASRARHYDERAGRGVQDAPHPTGAVYVAPTMRAP